MKSRRVLNTLRFRNLRAVTICPGWACFLLIAVTTLSEPTAAVSGTSAADSSTRGENDLLSHVRQLIFAGRRSGEGYFSADGKQMVFQSEREPGNPFFQIYLMDMETGETRRVSTGAGKTTCAWIHPSGEKVMFSSTHGDPEAAKKQREKIAFRASGRQRRYAWDYDEHFEIYEWRRDSGELTNLTRARGYDAEGAYSPDGRLIVFASNRHAHTDPLTESDAKKFAADPSFLMDIYLINADGTNIRRLTTTRGYDGGPFFAPDGGRICWRRFDEEGVRAEVFTMDLDGSDPRQITSMGAMSWAPFYHPSGDYLIFTTNVHGFANFELYIVDAEGGREPVRVTFTDGFDGLPAFTPDGEHLVWTTKRAGKESQLFMGDWKDAKARSLLGLTSEPGVDEVVQRWIASDVGAPEITEEDIRKHVGHLASDDMDGRLTGTRGEQLATEYVAGLFRRFGLDPAGDDNTYFQSFDFTAGVSLGRGNELACHGPDDRKTALQANHDWRPLAFSAVGAHEPAGVVFAGYGIVAAPPDENDPSGEYDSYVHLEVRDKWVLVFRYMPESIPAERRQDLARYARLRYKAMAARDRGAKGLVIVSGPNAAVKDELVPLTFDATLAGTSIPVLSVTNEAARPWFEAADRDPEKLQEQLDTGEIVIGFDLPGVKLEANIDIRQETRTGRNVLARLNAADRPGDSAVLVGAHVDHLGRGVGSTTLARDDEKGEIHHGADDNASGVAGLLEIAQYLADQKRRGTLKMKRDLIFATWSGEELGLLGSAHYARHFFGRPDDNATLYPALAANVNMDMIGRYSKALTLYGIGSSGAWPALIERANVPVGLTLNPQTDSYVPSDATTFYVKGVPILNGFTGAHGEYHTPRDTADLINYPGSQRVTRLFALIVRSLVTTDQRPDYIATRPEKKGATRATLRAYLGTIPDYSQTDIKGLKLSGVARDGPAAKAGVRGGDVVVGLAGRTVENIYDYTYAIEALKIGQVVELVVLRSDERVSLQVTPESRE